jgi:hypothetical protein
MTKTKRPRSTAPAPITPVRGSGWIQPEPEPIRMPDEWPVWFPAELSVRAEVVFGDACEKFRSQRELLPFCLYVITELGPDFRQWLPDPMPELVRKFMRNVLIANRRTPYEEDKMLEEIRRSPEFRALAREAAEGASIEQQRAAPPDEGKSVSKDGSVDRVALVNAYKDEYYAKIGKRLSDKSIWKTAGYTESTEFRRWRDRDAKYQPNEIADINFMRLLTVEKPHLK